jgi:hypothetical protein
LLLTIAAACPNGSVSKSSMDSFEAFERLKQSCVEDGLLKPAFGAGNLRITKKGQDFVNGAAIADPEVGEALEEAVRSPWRERRGALVSLLLFARERLGGHV